MLEFLQVYFSQAPAFGMNAFWISQGLVILAMSCDAASWQCKRRELILAWLVLAALLVGIHFWLLGQVAAAFIVLFSAVRFATSIFSTNQKLLYAFFAAVVLITYFTYQKPLDLLIMTAILITTFASFRPTDKSLREWMLPGTLLALLFDLLIFSPAAILLDLNFLLGNLAGYYRFYLKK